MSLDLILFVAIFVIFFVVVIGINYSENNKRDFIPNLAKITLVFYILIGDINISNQYHPSAKE